MNWYFLNTLQVTLWAACRQRVNWKSHWFGHSGLISAFWGAHWSYLPTMKNECGDVYFLHVLQLKRVKALHLQTLSHASMHNSFFFLETLWRLWIKFRGNKFHFSPLSSKCGLVIVYTIKHHYQKPWENTPTAGHGMDFTTTHWCSTEAEHVVSCLSSRKSKPCMYQR